MDQIHSVRWILTPVATLFSFAASLAGLITASYFLSPMLASFDVESFVPLDYRIACVGAAVAFATVLAGSRTAPASHAVVGLVIFVLGSWAAWFLLRHWYFPESHPRAYQESLMPLIGTEVGGLLGLAVVLWQISRSRIVPPAA